MLHHVIKWLYVRMCVELSMVVFVVTTLLANQSTGIVDQVERGQKLFYMHFMMFTKLK